MGRILAIDYGQKRTGLAVTDELKIFATALTTVPSAEAITFLKMYLQENKVECFVVGDPKQMNNTPSESARFIEPFVRRLQSEFPAMKIERVDERFTSKIATRTILEAGLKKMDRRNKARIDMVSAVIILQTYLETKQQSSSGI